MEERDRVTERRCGEGESHRRRENEAERGGDGWRDRKRERGRDREEGTQAGEQRWGERERKIPGQGADVSEPDTQRKRHRQPGAENNPEDVEINR